MFRFATPDVTSRLDHKVSERLSRLSSANWLPTSLTTIMVIQLEDPISVRTVLRDLSTYGQAVSMLACFGHVRYLIYWVWKCGSSDTLDNGSLDRVGYRQRRLGVHVPPRLKVRLFLHQTLYTPCRSSHSTLIMIGPDSSLNLHHHSSARFCTYSSRQSSQKRRNSRRPRLLRLSITPHLHVPFQV